MIWIHTSSSLPPNILLLELTEVSLWINFTIFTSWSSTKAPSTKLMLHKSPTICICRFTRSIGNIRMEAVLPDTKALKSNVANKSRNLPPQRLGSWKMLEVLFLLEHYSLAPYNHPGIAFQYPACACSRAEGQLEVARPQPSLTKIGPRKDKMFINLPVFCSNKTLQATMNDFQIRSSTCRIFRLCTTSHGGL